METQNLFSIITQLKNENKTIAYISHRFNELFAIADKFIVLRDGETVGEGNIRETNEAALIKMMSGRESLAITGLPSNNTGKTLLQVNNLEIPYPLSANGKDRKPLSFELNEGEILGIYGLMGAGRTELLETLFGLHKNGNHSSVLLQGKPIQINSPNDAIAAGIALVPEDRKRQGLVLEHPVKNNLVITVLDKLLNGFGLISAKKETAMATQYISALNIKAASDKMAVQSLSGGNQQKIVLAKWLALEPSVLLLDEPTRGVDVNAKAEIHEIIRAFSSKGKGVIMVSSELPEIMAVSHRILVICEGEISAVLKTNETKAETVLAHAIQKHQ
jgi:ribose transport system ATP-binding protein